MNLLAVRNLTKTYTVTPPVEVLRGSNLEVETGERVLIMGRSGAGKFTLLNILGLLDGPSDGECLFEDEYVERPSGARRNFIRARKIGLVFQGLHVLGHHSVTENFELKLFVSHISHARRETMIAGVLEAVGLSGRAEALIRLLSGGEKRHLAFARVVICDPQLILADEPTGNLDQENAAAILELPGVRTEKDVTVVVISHDERLWDQAGRVSRPESRVSHKG